MDNGKNKEKLEHWIWLQQAAGAGSAKPQKLLAAFGGIERVYGAGQEALAATGLLTERELTRLADKSLEKAQQIVGSCMEKGYRILTLPQLPQRLRDIYAPPCVLYLWGELPAPDSDVYIAMVGTRNITPYGVEAATKLAAGLVHCGAVVVSGMAVGVDGASHRGALKGGGKTVAVIGCGIDIDYPAPHIELKRLIAQNGAVVSEYPPGARPDQTHFPARNRIIAGLSLGCVVVEAGRRSGSLITATLAAEMGRDVFAVPGSIFSPYSDGTNRLLRDGAKPVLTVIDILEEYIGPGPQSIIPRLITPSGTEQGEQQLSFDGLAQSIAHPPKLTDKPTLNSDSKEKTPYVQTPPTDSNNEKSDKNPDATHSKKSLKSNPANCPSAAGLSERQRQVCAVLTDEPTHVDTIAVKANLELRVVLAVLTTLEIEGYVQSIPGRRYTLRQNVR